MLDSPEDAPYDPPLCPVLRPRPEGRDSAREHHVEDDARRPHVRGRRGVRAAHHLGTHEFQGATHRDWDAVGIQA